MILNGLNFKEQAFVISSNIMELDISPVCFKRTFNYLSLQWNVSKISAFSIGLLFLQNN